MNRADFRNLFAYSDNCWHLLGETLATAPPGAWDMPFETISQWNSIRLLLAHCLTAEERLVTVRLQNRPVPTPYVERAATDWARLYSDQQAIRAATYAYLDTVTDAEFEDQSPVLPATESRPALTRADLLFQIFNHENFHRGQIIGHLQRLGADPPDFDYMVRKSAR